jgi:hypothetical protein
MDNYARVLLPGTAPQPVSPPKHRERKLEVAVHELRQINEILFGAMERLETACGRIFGNLPQPAFDGDQNGMIHGEPTCQLDMLRATMQQTKHRALQVQHFASVLDDL